MGESRSTSVPDEKSTAGTFRFTLQRCSYAEEYVATMKPIVPPRNLYEHVLRALNAITRPSTAEEITDKLRSQLRKGEKPFSVREVTQQLRNIGDGALVGLGLLLLLVAARSDTLAV
jgi:hypothetical protein